jgi:hypothetical protein
MRRRVLYLRVVLVVGSLLVFEGAALAQATRVTVDFQSNTITFPSADPDLVASVAAQENPVSIRVRVSSNPGNWVLTLIAAGDFTSGLATIPATTVNWTTSGPPFSPGTLSRTTPVLVAQGVGNVNTQATMSFFLANSWSYVAGNYSQTVLFTLTAP